MLFIPGYQFPAVKLTPTNLFDPTFTETTAVKQVVINQRGDNQHSRKCKPPNQTKQTQNDQQCQAVTNNDKAQQAA